jgi:hypothetical protein
MTALFGVVQTPAASHATRCTELAWAASRMSVDGPLPALHYAQRNEIYANAQAVNLPRRVGRQEKLQES